MKKRSTPEFKREIRQMIHGKVQEFLDDYDVDDVADNDGGMAVMTTGDGEDDNHWTIHSRREEADEADADQSR